MKNEKKTKPVTTNIKIETSTHLKLKKISLEMQEQQEKYKHVSFDTILNYLIENQKD